MKTFPQQLQALLQPAVQEVIGSDASAQVVPAADSRFGDYQSNVAMTLAKSLKRNPRELAQAIQEKIPDNLLCESITIAGPGFLNFTLRKEALAERVQAMSADERLLVRKVDEPKKIVIDYSAPNVAKPMHVGHLRTTVIGSVLDRIARFLGHSVISDNHLGDWGTQFGYIIYGWKNHIEKAAFQASPIKEVVRVYREVQDRAKEDPALQHACKEEVVKLQQGDEENKAIWLNLVEITHQEINRLYDYLEVSFDHTLGESFYNDRLGPLVERLIAQGIARESQGAICVFFEEHPKLADKPCLIRKSDGGFLYSTTDLATLEYRLQEWNANAIWYVVGAPQQLHLQQVFETARKMGITIDLQHIAFGSILGKDRKLMRTRSGENVLLEAVLEEAIERAEAIILEKNPDLPENERKEIARIIGIGAVKYAELSQHRMTDNVFDFDRMLSFQGNTAPYLQNAYVRTRSIFRKMTANGETFDEQKAKIQVTTSEERTLVVSLVKFAEVVPEVLEDFRPNILANYLYELAGHYHTFFEACPVLKAEPALRNSRLLLCRTTGDTLALGLQLLGIKAPERM